MKGYINKRRTTPRVLGGKVQRKNRSALTPNYYNTPQSVPLLERQKPGKGYKHVIRKQHLIDFISILPDWDELSTGLNAVLLAPGDDECDGWHDRGIVAVCAWPRTIWIEVLDWYYDEHAGVLARLGIPSERSTDGYLCKFTEGSVRAYQLLHILLHELGHHHDRMTTQTRLYASRGEGYAEEYARKYSEVIWNRYLEVLGIE